MKKILLFVSLLMCVAFVNAQEATKQLVYVHSFTGPDGMPHEALEGIESAVIRGMVESNRVMVKNFSSDYEFNRELEERKEDASVSEKDFTFQLLNNRGAKFVIEGVVTHFDAVYKKNDDGSTYWDAKIEVALELTDVSKGVVTMTKQLTTDKSLTGIITDKGSTIGSSKMEALTNAVEILVKRAKLFAEENFKLGGFILEVDEVKKEEAKTVYINMGEAAGVKKGDIFEVFETRMIAGRESQKKIGELKVIDVQGDDIALCSVKNGGGVIFTKMKNLNDGEKLTIKSRMKKAPLGGLGGLL